MARIALLAGASGMVGRQVLYCLLENPQYEKVVSFSRKELPVAHPKLVQRISDLSSTSNLKTDLTGDDLFCCLGTTIRQAGSQEAFRRVDLELVVELARMAVEQGAKQFIGVSSIGASAQSGNFYLRTKGQMEAAVRSLPFQRAIMVRPSLLLGNRKENRFGEEAAKVFMKVAGFFFFGPLRKYRGIEAADVARAMVSLALSPSSDSIVESDRLQDIANQLKKV